MHKVYTLFIIGFLTALPIPIIDNLDEIDEPEELEEFLDHPIESYMNFLKNGTKVWMLSYLIILAITIPIKIIPSFENRLSPRNRLVLNFVSGQSFGYVIIRIITFSF